MAKLKSVLIMAGGTGGHVFPALAVAKRLREKGIEVHWLGTQKGLEARVVPEAGFPLHFISISGLRGKGLKNFLLAPFKMLYAFSQSLRVMQQIKPSVVLGMGGFVSGPGGIASVFLRRPLIIHEQNAKPGFTNRCLSHFAKKILEGFPDTFSKRKKVITAGNPVRTEIAAIQAPRERFAKQSNKKFQLLVLGGSLGAQAINELVPRALAKLSLEDRPQVLHQAGEKHFAETVAAYQKAEVTADIVPFIVEMNAAYSSADIVLCRAGALTVAELCAAGVGAIFVPFPFAVDDHQTANANFMVKHHAAILVQQKDLTENSLTNMLQQLMISPENRIKMACAAYQLRKINATDTVVKVCKEIVGELDI